MTLIIENVKDEFLPAFKGLAKSINAKYKVSKTKPSDELLEAINEAREMRKNPNNYQGYTNMNDLKTALES